MKDVFNFQRVESKYLLSVKQEAAFLSALDGCLCPDEHGISTISSIYMDTPDLLLLRASMEKAAYKEKLRLRCYGTPTLSDSVFLEIKKKYRGVVYKRRVKMSLKDAYSYLREKKKPCDSQIMREIDYAFRFYDGAAPALLISYERRAFTLREDPSVRITFDRNVRYRRDHLLLEEGSRGTILLPSDSCVMEIKTSGGMPLTLSHLLDRCGIFPASFSKYKKSHLDAMESRNENGGIR